MWEEDLDTDCLGYSDDWGDEAKEVDRAVVWLNQDCSRAGGTGCTVRRCGDSFGITGDDAVGLDGVVPVMFGPGEPVSWGHRGLPVLICREVSTTAAKESGCICCVGDLAEGCTCMVIGVRKGDGSSIALRAWWSYVLSTELDRAHRLLSRLSNSLDIDSVEDRRLGCICIPRGADSIARANAVRCGGGSCGPMTELISSKRMYRSRRHLTAC